MSERRMVQRLVDGGIAMLLAGIAVAEIWVPFTSVQGDGSRVLSTVVAVGVSLALAARRAAPLAAALVVLLTWPVVFTVTPLLVLFWGQFVPMVVAVFSVARHGAGRRGVYGAVAGVATLLFLDLRVQVLQTPGEIVFHWLVFTVAWTVGRGVHVADLRAAAAQRRAVAAEVASAEQAMVAVVEERTRIARELHDVVAHSVSMMVVQAGAAEQVVDDDPEHVRKALETIRSTGTEALAEMRRLVAMIREEDEPGTLTPQPGLGQLDSLVDSARSGGLAVALTVSGQRPDLPAGLDLAAFRILQEALTNVRRHARASRADVSVRFTDVTVELEVSDDGVGATPSGTAPGAGPRPGDHPSAGHGLVGMRERAALYGGRVEAGRRDDASGRGFVVHATLPLAASADERLRA